MSDIQIIQGDCLEVMKTFADNQFDLVLTDPPYNVGIDYGGTTNDKMPDDDYGDWIGKRLVEMVRIAKTVLITGQKPLPFLCNTIKPKWILAWRKGGAMGRSPVGFCNYEPVAMYGKGTTTSCDIFEASIIPDKSLDGHPCPKPLKWALKQIEMFKEYENILDPFLGSGTTAVACERMGRNCVGIEISEEYCEIARKRVQEEKDKMGLFNGD